MQEEKIAGKKGKKISRRDFMGGVAAATAAFTIAPRYVMADSGQRPLSEKAQGKSSNWIADTFRNVYWDFNISPKVPDIAVNFDPEAAGAMLKRAHIQAIYFTSRTMYGYCYYDTKVGVKQPHLQRNLLPEVIDLCHRNDVKVISTFQLLYDDRVAKAHPDWRAVKASGRPYLTWTMTPLCVNSPYLEKYVLPELAELVEQYDIDGILFDPIAHGLEEKWCYCSYCQAKFKKRFGEKIPQNRKSPLGLQCVKWRREILDDFRRSCCEAVHRIKPGLPVTINNALCGTHYPSDPPDYIDFLHKEVKMFTGKHMDISYFSRYLATLDKPFRLLPNRFQSGWADWDLKPVAMLKYEAAAMIANGTTCCVGDQIYPDGRFEEQVYNSIGEVYGFIKQREEFCRQAKPVPYIAILHSEATMNNNDNDLSLTLAAHKALVESSIHFNIINEDTLLRSLGDYKTLIIPEQNCLSDKVIKAVRDFVKEGGGLIASGSTSLSTETGKQRGDFGLADVFGVKYQQDYPDTYAYFKVIDESVAADIGTLPMHIDGQLLYVKPTSARTLANLVRRAYWKEIPGRFNLGSFAPAGEDTGYPAVTVNQFGKGKAAYISADLFQSYWKKNRVQTKYLVRNLVDLVTADKLLEVKADASVEVSLFKQDSALVLHLLFYYIAKILDGPRWAVVENIPPVHDISVKLKVAGPPQQVVQMPEKRDLKWKLEDGLLSFRVPQFHIHTCVVIT